MPVLWEVREHLICTGRALAWRCSPQESPLPCNQGKESRGGLGCKTGFLPRLC